MRSSSGPRVHGLRRRCSTSGFQIVHRYAYVLIPLDGEPSIAAVRGALRRRAHQTWIDERAFADTPGDWLRRRAEERAGGGSASTASTSS